MKEFLKFGLKAYFGGCFGCLGSISILLVLMLAFGLVFGSRFTSLIQSLPALFSQGLPSLGGKNAFAANPAEIKPMEIFLTLGNNPDAGHLTSFKVSQYKQIYFWVRSAQVDPVNFTLLMTLPDGNQHQFGPDFKTAGANQPTPCGQFGDQAPQIGQYKIEVVPVGSSNSVGSVTFTIIK